MRWRNIVSTLIVWSLLFGMAAVADIIIPKENKRDSKILGSYDFRIPEPSVPEVEKVDKRGPGWTKSEGAAYYDTGDGNLCLWGAPGDHWVAFETYWVHWRWREFKDGDSNLIKIREYIDSGFVDEIGEYTVLGKPDPIPPLPDDDDDDDGPPPPGQDYQIMLFYDGDMLDNYPAAQRAILTSLVIREQLESQGHVIVEILEKAALGQVSPKYKAFIDAVINDQMPRIALAPKDGGKVLDFPLPENREALQVLLNNPSVGSYFGMGVAR